MISKNKVKIISLVIISITILTIFPHVFAFTAINNYKNDTTFNPCVSGCDLWVEKFINLQEGSTLKNIVLNVTANAGSAIFGIYDSNGYYNSQSDAGGSDFGTVEAFNGSLYLVKATFLPATTLNITSLGFYNLASEEGDHNTIHVRLKLYQDGNGSPTTLLGETASTLVPFGTGAFNIPISTTLTSGSTVWIALETDASANDNIFDGQNCPCSASTLSFPHIYGAGPPDLTNAHDLGPSVKGPTLYISYNFDGGFAGKFLGQSKQIAINSTGLQTFPLNSSIIIPSDSVGKIWVAYETTSSSANLLGANGLGPNQAAAGAQLVGPSSFPNPYVSAANETVAAWMELNGIAPSSTVSFRPTLFDNFTQLTSSRVLDKNSTSSETLTANTTGWVSFTGLNGDQNFTVFDDKNFEVEKIINDNVTSNVSKNLATNDISVNCVGAYSGYQSDFIVRINDTDGTHITDFSPILCPIPNLNQLLFNVTFTGNGNSAAIFSSSMITTVTNQVYEANPINFTVNNSPVVTTWTGTNIISNPFTVGSGLSTEKLDFIVSLKKTESTNAGGQSGGSPQLYTTTNSSCFAGVFNPLTNSCQFGLIGVTVTVPPIVVNPTSSNTTTINIQCQGTPYLTINNVNLGSNPLGFQIIGLPTTVDCGQNTSTPSSCPVGTTLQNGECITSATCPLANQLSNGQCVGPVSCPSGSNAVNGQCIIPATCSGGVQPVNGVCQVNGTIIVQAPPTNSSQSCGLTNPIACVTGSSQSEPATLTGVAPNGQSVAVNTVLTSLTNPELNNVSIVMIGLIITAAIGGAVYRYILKKEKSSSRKPRKTNGKKGNIEKFNSNLRKK